MQEIYSSPAFESAYTYSGNDLGAVWSESSTRFCLWAPTAQDVKVQLFFGGDPEKWDFIRAEALKPAERGTWRLDLPGDWSGVYYTYLVTVNGKTLESSDPYAVSAGVNGFRSMILDLKATNPAGWEDDTQPYPVESITDAVICEVHIRDISMDPSSGIYHKGKFLGLTETGTHTPNGTPTGLDHLKNLGVTHVQLMPVYDFGSVDERVSGYNWGYDPMNFNVPEGSYATDAHHGEVRVMELKQMVKALHDAGFGVIMDVVYNHVYHADSFSYNRIVPGYFSRPGSNGSGCGNDTASERSMVAKFIADSVLYWVEEYHIDGFRFDLAGLIDAKAIRLAMDAVKEKHPQVLFYGEGWIMDSKVCKADVVLATQKASNLLPEFGFFNDTLRDLLRGSVFLTQERGFAAGGQVNEDSLRSCFMGVTPWACSPQQSINYVSCHDNHTLLDRLTISLRKTPRAERIRRSRLAAAFSMLSQGVPFFLSGEEMLRSKPIGWGHFDENSYRSGDSVNALRWGWLEKPEYQRNAEYYKGLIALRKAHPCLRLRTREEALSSIKALPCKAPGTVAFRIRSSSERLIAIFHSGDHPTEFTLPDGSWELIADGDHAGTESLKLLAGTITIPPISAFVLVQKKPRQTKDVVAALIWQGDRVLICQRPAHKARGLLWEFVGGKVEAGETMTEALIRECKEELDVIVQPGEVFMSVRHDYPDIHIRLTLYHCTIPQGEPKALEHMDLRWITPSEIPEYNFCPADKDILAEIVRHFK